MRKTKICSLVMAGMMLFSNLAGCGDTIPNLTAEENWMIAEYSAGLLLKYDAHHVRRLVSDDEIDAAYAEAYQNAEWQWKVEKYQEEQKKEEMEASSHGGNGLESSADTEVVDYSMEEILGISGTFQIEYLGYEVCKSYPSEDSEDYYVAMEATGGNDLFILHYQMTNLTGEEQLCDILHSGVTFSATINEKKYGSQLTLLMDDLSQYYEVIPAYESRQVAILFQIPEEMAYDIESVSLKVKSKTMNNRFILE